jgi:hypothetical protein
MSASVIVGSLRLLLMAALTMATSTPLRCES